MSTQPLTLVFADGKRLYVRNAEGVPREGDHAFALGVYYRIAAVVWQFGTEIQGGDRCIPAMPTEIHLRPAAAPACIDCEALVSAQAPALR
jgi:hypothetical protein